MMGLGNKASFSHLDHVLGPPQLATGIGANLEGHGEFQSKSCMVDTEHWGRTAPSTLFIKIFSEPTSLVHLFTDYTSLRCSSQI